MKPVQLVFEDDSRAWPVALRGRQVRPMKLAGVALLVIAAAWLLASLLQLAQTRQELAATEAELQALGRRQPVAVTPKPALRPEQRRAWNQVVRQLNTPWGGLLAVLEATTPDDVALVSIEPDARQGSVRIQAEARTLEVLLAYAQSLKGAGLFADVVPVKYETNEQDPNRPARLMLNLQLRSHQALATAPGEVR
ncbi:MAG TPA: hypothetical protein VIL30_08780 [Ramlibacter sp.]|jgi:hypothetical protein